MLKLNADSAQLYNETRANMIAMWERVDTTNKQDIANTYHMFRKSIDALDSSNDEPEHNEIDAGHAHILRVLNITRMDEAFKQHKGLTPSHAPCDSNSIEVQAPTTTTHEDTNMNAQASINLDSMNLQELVALQLKVAQRINAWVENMIKPMLEQVRVEPAPQVCSPAPERGELQPLPQINGKDAAPKAARVKKSKAPSKDIKVPVVEDVVVEAKPSTQQPPVEKTAASTMKYADLRTFISTATKTNPEAKRIAQEIAKKHGAKSWATCGRMGYEEIYNILTK